VHRLASDNETRNKRREKY